MQVNKNTEYLIVSIAGGIGKVISSTAAIRCLKKAYPDKKIIVLSGWPEVFDLNPHVYRTFRFNEYRHMYDDYAKSSTLLMDNPYHFDSYRHENKHIVETYCEAWGVEFDGDHLPELYLDEELLTIANKKIFDIRNQAPNLPIIVTQYVGRLQKDETSGTFLPSGRECLPLFSVIMNKICQRCVLLVMKDADQPVINVPHNTLVTKNQIHFRHWMATMAFADGFLGIDSCGHHMAAAFKKPSIVLWGRTNYKNLGYEYPGMIHLVNDECPEAPCNGFINAPVLGWRCKHNYKCMKSFDADKVVEKIIENFKLPELQQPQQMTQPQPKEEMKKVNTEQEKESIEIEFEE